MGIFGALTTSVAGLRANSYALENISGNIANSQTTAFKRIDTSFMDIIPDTGANAQLAGSVTAGSRSTNTIAGSVQAAAVSTYMAINGDGFFAVQTAGGVRYTRNGEFQSDADGNLVTPLGDKVLGRNNQPVKLGADGKVDPRNLNVVLLNNPEKVGNNYITGTPGTVAGQVAGTVRAGALEGSGADANQAMVDMIASMRAYEAGQKVIHTIDETLGKAASSVGSLSS